MKLARHIMYKLKTLLSGIESSVVVRFYARRIFNCISFLKIKTDKTNKRGSSSSKLLPPVLLFILALPLTVSATAQSSDSKEFTLYIRIYSFVFKLLFSVSSSFATVACGNNFAFGRIVNL